MEAITLPIYSSEGKEVEALKLDPAVFDGVVNKAAIYQAVVAFRANQRKGLASTKTRGEVSGGGKKPWRQKGTGRARAGSIRSPLWRHGGAVFGPHPRDFSIRLPQKIKDVALRSCLNLRAKDNDLVLLDGLQILQAKTKDAYRLFCNLKLSGGKGRQARVLLLLEKMDKISKLALRNLDFLEVNLAVDTNAYQVLSSRKLVMTKGGLQQLIKRLKK